MSVSTALNYLKIGAFMSFVAFLILFIGFFVAIGSVAAKNAFGIIFSTITIFLALIITFVGFLRLYEAASALSRMEKKYSVGKAGMLIQIAGLITMVLGLASYAFSFGFATLIIFTAFVAILIGGVLFGLMLSRMEEIHPNFKISGAIYVVGAIANVFFSGLGYVLIAVSMFIAYRACKFSG